jgi:hypothetical protein
LELEEERMRLTIEVSELRVQNANIRKRLTNQRRELKRLNRQSRPYWLGFETGLKFSDATRLRGIMNATFGYEKVRAAELDAVHHSLQSHDRTPIAAFGYRSLLRPRRLRPA